MCEAIGATGTFAERRLRSLAVLGLLADVLSLALPVQLLLLASTVLRCCCVAGWRGSSSENQDDLW